MTKRQTVTHVYWTLDEKQIVEKHARAQGVPLSTWLRQMALDAAKSAPKSDAK